MTLLLPYFTISSEPMKRRILNDSGKNKYCILFCTTPKSTITVFYCIWYFSLDVKCVVQFIGDFKFTSTNAHVYTRMRLIQSVHQMTENPARCQRLDAQLFLWPFQRRYLMIQRSSVFFHRFIQYVGK